MFPIPNAAAAANSANARASQRPVRWPTPCSRKYIGPPLCSPRASVVRKRTERSASEYFVAIPTRPVIHIQKSAPGPPAAIAVATPTMLPVPTVAASAVMSAWKWVMSPSASGSRRTTNPSHSACGELPELEAAQPDGQVEARQQEEWDEEQGAPDEAGRLVQEPFDSGHARRV